MTQTVAVTVARQRFGELVNQVYKRQARIIIEKNVLPAVALVAVGDLERWLSREGQGPMTAPDSGMRERLAVAGGIAARASASEELAQRQALVEAILANAKCRSIRPHTTSELVEEAREERDETYERWTR